MNPAGYLRFFLLWAAMGSVAQAAAVERVVAIGDDQSVMLASTGKARFADIVFPDAALAQGWLAAHLLQQDIDFSALDTDRYGRTLISSVLEEAMLRDGIAVLFPQENIPEGWSAAEDAARQAKRGVWAAPEFILTPETAASHLQQFHVVEGTVTHIFHNKTATYLNFGADWHTDFSITIAGRARRSIEAQLVGVHEGSRIRVRGALYEENGPMIRVTRPEQITLF